MKIPPIPDDYLPVIPKRYQHVWNTGTHNDYHWLQSNQVNIKDFFATVKPPKNGFRFAGLLYDRWAKYPDPTKLSPLQQSWPHIVMTFMGDYLFFFPETTLESELVFILREAQGWTFERYPQDLVNETLKEIQDFWNQLELASPILFYRQYGDEFTLVCKHQEMLSKFMLSPIFQSSEERTKAKLIQERPSKWKQLFERLGPECGPEKCIDADCENLRIKVAVRCVRHQLKRFSSQDFD